MKLRMCRCRHCRAGRKGIWMQARIRSMAKGYRHKVRILLGQGEYERLPLAVPIGYTD